MSDMLDDALAQLDERLGIEPVAPEEGTPAEQPEETPEPQAEAPASQVPDEEALGTVEADERPRDEQGRFLPKETETPEPEAEPLERRLADKDEFIGRQSNEIGELRERLARLEGRAEVQPAQQTQSAAPVNQEWFEEQVEQNPQGAAVWAAQNNHPQLVEQAMDYWYDVQPRAAAAFERRAELAHLEQQWEERLTQSTAPLQQQAQQQGVTSAFEALAAKLPDAFDRMPQIKAAAEAYPHVGQGLLSNDPAERQQTAESLYYLAAGISGAQAGAPQPTGTQDAAAAAVEATQAARDAKLAGSVASQTQTGEAEITDPGEAWLDSIGFDAFLDSRNSE